MTLGEYNRNAARLANVLRRDDEAFVLFCRLVLSINGILREPSTRCYNQFNKYSVDTYGVKLLGKDTNVWFDRHASPAVNKMEELLEPYYYYP